MSFWESLMWDPIHLMFSTVWPMYYWVTPTWMFQGRLWSSTLNTTIIQYAGQKHQPIRTGWTGNNAQWLYQQQNTWTVFHDLLFKFCNHIYWNRWKRKSTKTSHSVLTFARHFIISAETSYSNFAKSIEYLQRCLRQLEPGTETRLLLSYPLMVKLIPVKLKREFCKITHLLCSCSGLHYSYFSKTTWGENDSFWNMHNPRVTLAN